MDVFNQDAFSATSLTAAVDKVGHVPTLLGDLGVFVPPPLGQPNTTHVWIESRGTEAALIQTSARGSEPKQKGGDDNAREARPFATRRLAQASRITASELQNIRAFGSATELEALQTQVARRQALIQRDFDLTLENMRLSCVLGAWKDADGTTLIDWEAAFGQTIPTEVTWTLSASTGDGATRTACATAARSIIRGLKGLGGPTTRIVALCSDTFWDKLVASKEVRETYLASVAASDLRTPTAWETFNYGGVTFINYRGTDDNSTVAITAGAAKFFPVGAGIFQMAFAPAERFEFVNTPGQSAYSWMITDPLRNAWADVEMYSYPLAVCTMPQALYRANI
jgi:hypothetical protein